MQSTVKLYFYNQSSTMPGQSLHTFASHAEVAAAALGSVYAVNEFGKALADDTDGSDGRFIKAAVGAAVAVGAYHQLSKKADKIKKNGSNQNSDRYPPHHSRHLLEEAAGAYALGKELLGDDKHHIAHLIAEAMGATGLIRDIQHRHQDGK